RGRSASAVRLAEGQIRPLLAGRPGDPGEADHRSRSREIRAGDSGDHGDEETRHRRAEEGLRGPLGLATEPSETTERILLCGLGGLCGQYRVRLVDRLVLGGLRVPDLDVVEEPVLAGDAQ